MNEIYDANQMFYNDVVNIIVVYLKLIQISIYDPSVLVDTYVILLRENMYTHILYYLFNVAIEVSELSAELIKHVIPPAEFSAKTSNLLNSA